MTTREEGTTVAWDSFQPDEVWGSLYATQMAQTGHRLFGALQKPTLISQGGAHQRQQEEF